jgi:hypothetical protein
LQHLLAAWFTECSVDACQLLAGLRNANGHPPRSAIAHAFPGNRIAHGTLTKTDSVTHLAVNEASRRYSPAEAVAVARDVVSGCVKLQETKSAAHDMGLKISGPELDALVEPQRDVEQPSSAITIRNRLGHDFGPTQVCHIHRHGPRLIPIMVRFIDDIDRVVVHLDRLWNES